MLTPELLESYFILYRLTGDEKYRDHAWRLAQVIYKYGRSEDSGFVSFRHVNRIPPVANDYQPSHFLGATLKYLYLIFEDRTSVLPLDKWVFNAAGHPLPVCGSSELYPKEKC